MDQKPSDLTVRWCVAVLWPGGSNTYTYDAAGRTTQVVAPNGTTNIVYDFESRITSLTGPGITQTSVYNGLHTRVSTTVNNSTRAFGRDGVYVTDPVLTHGTDTSFTPGISERRSGTTTFLHSGLKNADAQSSTAQAITATRTYDAFGMIRSSTGTWRGPFGYAGGFGYQEDASGLRLLGHRYYDASTGRFLTRDPIKDGRNWYAYGAGEANPLTMADPTGLIHLTVMNLIDSGVLPPRDPFPYRGAGGITPEYTPAHVAEHALVTFFESPFPLPITDPINAIYNIPYLNLDKRNQMYDDFFDGDDESPTLTWDQDPEYHQTPFVPSWRKQ